MDLKAYIVLKPVDKKHQLKEDYLVLDHDQPTKVVRIHDPYEGYAGFKRIPEQKPGAEFHFKCEKVIENTVTAVHKESHEEIVKEVVKGERNGFVIQYGQSKSGKGSTLFGNLKHK